MIVASSEKRRRIHRVNVRARRIEEDRKEVGRKREKREVKEVTREGESERRKGGDEIDGTRWNWAPGGGRTLSKHPAATRGSRRLLSVYEWGCSGSLAAEGG